MENDTDRLPDRAPAPEEIVGLLADPVRRRVVALLDDRELGIDELLADADVDARTLIDQVGRLESARVIVEEGGRYSLAPDVFAKSVRHAASQRLGPLNDRHTHLARRYFFRNRLIAMPAEPEAVEIVLELIAQDFQPGETYSEREVNTTLYAWYGDWALLRRLLVDHRHLERSGGRYWRTARQG